MKVMITGVDGYLGWPLALHLASLGHQVGGIDDLSRRRVVESVGSCSAIPISSLATRLGAFRRRFGHELRFWGIGLIGYDGVKRAYQEFQPDAIVYLGEMPSAPWSMVDFANAKFTHVNNVMGTLATLFAMREVCPNAHLIKLGTMGEYGTPACDIPEGHFPPKSRWITGGDPQFSARFTQRGDLTGLMFPRQAGSWYHLTKVHDTHNVEFACRNWGLCSTDIMQGIVCGTRIEAMGDDPILATRFDFDECFGTVVNRFCAQSVIGHSLTVYGTGGQTRGFLALQDVMDCITLTLDNPPASGEYRTFNQFGATYSVAQVAAMVAEAGKELGLGTIAGLVDNPRKEAEKHWYNPDRQRLVDLGYTPRDIRNEIANILRSLQPHARRILRKDHLLQPTIKW